MRDVGQRVLEEMTGQRREKADIPAGSILIAEDLTPSDTASLDRTKVVGFCTTAGGASSHVAILARSLDIPAVAGIEPRALDIAEGTRVILDGAKGTLRMNVTEDEVARIRQRQERSGARRAVELAHADEPANTVDGHHVEVVANIGGLDDAAGRGDQGRRGRRAAALGVRLPGPARSAPTEDEQAKIYTDIAEARWPGQPLVIRTLDVGGDKPLPYLPMAPEENPFLGERGIRVGLDRPEILRTQVRAILRAADAGAKINVMFPMIATIEDFRLAKAIFEEERERARRRADPGRDHGRGAVRGGHGARSSPPRWTSSPSAPTTSPSTPWRWTAATRSWRRRWTASTRPCSGSSRCAAKAAHAAGRWVGVCGGIASDPQAVPMLVGLGVDELSVSMPGHPVGQGPDPVAVPRALPGTGRPRPGPGLRRGPRARAARQRLS